MREMIVTGGVASGKSTFCRRWVECADVPAVWHDADAAVHEAYGASNLRERVRERFGESVLVHGEVDRKALGEIVFRDKVARRDLEAMIHPLVREHRDRARQQARREGASWFLCDIPLFFETGGRGGDPDRPVVLVACPPHTQRRRLAERNGLDKSRASRILAAQMPLERKLALCDHVIWNEAGEDVLDRQLRLLYEHLRAGDEAGS